MPATPSNRRSRMRDISHRSLAVSLTLHLLVLLCLAGSIRFDKCPDPIIVSTSFGTGEHEERRSDQQASSRISIAQSTDQVTGELVARKIHATLSQQKGKSSAEQLERLDDAANRLSQISSEKSIDEMTDRFRAWLAIPARAVQPNPAANAAEGDFDFDSAQLHDARKGVDDRGEMVYVLVLLDAEGRTHEMQTDGEDAKLLYDMMQRIKKNPLLEKLYRQLVMPLLDRFIHGEPSDGMAGSSSH